MRSARLCLQSSDVLAGFGNTEGLAVLPLIMAYLGGCLDLLAAVNRSNPRQYAPICTPPPPICTVLEVASDPKCIDNLTHDRRDQKYLPLINWHVGHLRRRQ
jgi:hypothetical protein